MLAHKYFQVSALFHGISLRYFTRAIDYFHECEKNFLCIYLELVFSRSLFRLIIFSAQSCFVWILEMWTVHVLVVFFSLYFSLFEIQCRFIKIADSHVFIEPLVALFVTYTNITRVLSVWKWEKICELCKCARMCKSVEWIRSLYKKYHKSVL